MILITEEPWDDDLLPIYEGAVLALNRIRQQVQREDDLRLLAQLEARTRLIMHEIRSRPKAPKGRP